MGLPLAVSTDAVRGSSSDGKRLLSLIIAFIVAIIITTIIGIVTIAINANSIARAKLAREARL